jgi:hypothetical protein
MEKGPGIMKDCGFSHTAADPSLKFPATMEVPASLLPPARSGLFLFSPGELEACLRFTAAKPKFGLAIPVF